MQAQPKCHDDFVDEPFQDELVCYVASQDVHESNLQEQLLGNQIPVC